MKQRSNSSARQFRLPTQTLTLDQVPKFLTDLTGERRNRQFRQRFRGLRSHRPNPSGGSGVKCLSTTANVASILPSDGAKYEEALGVPPFPDFGETNREIVYEAVGR